MDHGEDVREGDVNVLALLVRSKTKSRGPDEGSNVVGSLSSLPGRPGQVVLVGEDSSGQRSSVVSTPSNEHESIHPNDPHQHSSRDQK